MPPVIPPAAEYPHPYVQNTGYIPLPGGGVIVPSSKASGSIAPDITGERADGFDPHALDPRLHPNAPQRAPKPGTSPTYPDVAPPPPTPDADVDEFSGVLPPQAQPVQHAPAPSPSPVPRILRDATFEPKHREPDPNQPPPPRPPTALLYYHLTGLKVPYRYHELALDLKRGVLALVSDTRHQGDPLPVLDVTPDGAFVVVSTPAYDRPLRCIFAGQQFTIEGHLAVTVLMIVGHADEPLPGPPNPDALPPEMRQLLAPPGMGGMGGMGQMGSTGGMSQGWSPQGMTT